MPISHQKLIGLQRAEFAKAARLQRFVLRVQVAIACVAGIAVFVSGSTGTYLASVAAVFLALIWAWLWWHYRQSRAQAERARRATLLMDGLGAPISPSELRNLAAHFTVDESEGANHEDPNYYTARSAPGDQRLAEMLEETTFWSADLMRHSAQRTWIVFSIYLILGLGLLFTSVPFAAAEQLQGVARVSCALLTLLVSTDVLGAAIAFSGAARAIESMIPRLEAVRASGFPRADLLLVFADYNSAVEGAPTYPPGIYERRRQRLNELWNQRQPTRVSK